MMAKTNPLFPTLQPSPLQPTVGMGTKTGHVWRHYTPPCYDGTQWREDTDQRDTECSLQTRHRTVSNTASPGHRKTGVSGREEGPLHVTVKTRWSQCSAH